MTRRIMLEVTQPYHPDGKNLVHAPGDLLEPGTDLPEGLAVREVIADVPEVKTQAQAGAAAGQAKAKP